MKFGWVVKAAGKIGAKTKHARKFAEQCDTSLAAQGPSLASAGDFNILRFTYVNEARKKDPLAIEQKLGAFSSEHRQSQIQRNQNS